MDAFRAATRAWFEETFREPTPVQRRGWAEIASGRHALLVAPTGSGKTLAAFLWGIDALAGLSPDAPPGVRVLYVSPLKALAHDVERNLRAPLAGVARTAERLGESARAVRIDVRTGDTPQRERQRQARDPGEILVTTPESLFLILGSRQRETLRTVTTVIVDEIHALAPSKRGAHLALSLERLAELAEHDPQRIGLSATVRPLDEVARFLGGDRDVAVVDTSEAPLIELSIEVPVPDMENVPPPQKERERGGSVLGLLYKHQVGAPMHERGIWPAMYPELVDAIRSHRSTIVFVNSRGLAERVTQRINALAEEELALAHHGSVSHAKRAEIEDGLKAGRLRAIVATSSLELGIDMGAVDLVVLVESPGSVARGLQRVGRAGHHVGAKSVGRIFPKFRGDLLECAVIAGRMLAGEIEALAVPKSCLDVLAQQIVAMCVVAPREVGEIERVVRRAYPYRELAGGALHSVLDMLSGRYPSHDFADLRPRLRWDRARDVLSARPGAAMVSRTNAGTIPDRGAFAVQLGEDGPRIGELEEEMVFESRAGDTFLLGASTWRVETITRDRVIVSPAPGEPGRLPFWKGDGPGRPLELGRALGAFVRELGERSREDGERWLRATLPLGAYAAANLAAYVADQREATGALPTDRAIVVERFRDELGDWRVCILTPFGSRVHAPWAMALERTLSARAGFEVQLMYTDDGIVLRLADVDDLPALAELLPDPDEVLDLVTEQLGDTSLFASLFRENAVRSLLVTRRRPDQRSPLWAQRIKARNLLATVRRYPSFPIVLETYRQALSDVFDLPALREVLGAIRARTITVHEVETRSPSPFARSLVFAYVAAYLYEGDSPIAERKAQALTLDRSLLAELLGQAELRDLLDADAIDAVESELQGTADERRASDRDELCDRLRRVGDLSAGECAERASGDPAPWLAELESERRAVRVRIAGEERWIAADDAGLYRDALGCAPPAGLPSDFLAAPEDPLTELVRRFARTHGPFTTRAAAARWVLAPAQVEPVLRALEAAGELVRGELRPGGTELEWCDAEVLRRIKRRTLARLRDEVAAVDEPTFARFLARWQGVRVAAARRGDATRERRGQPDGALASRGPERLLEVVAQLEGLALPWSTLVREVLPARVDDFSIDALDLLAAQGRVVWVGRGALGPSDGRVALYRRERAGELLGAREPVQPHGPHGPHEDVHAAILEHVDARGASFLTEIERAVRGRVAGTTTRELESALWDLVWTGVMTNDTFGPLRTLGASPGRGRRAQRSAVLAGGRWSRVAAFAGAEDPTRAALARAQTLLERYGVVSREAVAAEDVAGGFGPLYKVLRAMEEAGQVRRGWFVEGLSGAQFCPPGAADRLRALRPSGEREHEVVTLAALDPASPWGALLAWPPTGAPEGSRPRRVAGARVILVDGRPVLWLPASSRHVLTFPPPPSAEGDPLAAAFGELATLRRGASRRSLSVETIDGVSAQESPHRERLERAGFVRDYRGYLADPRAVRDARG